MATNEETNAAGTDTRPPMKKLSTEFNDEENQLEMAATQAEIILSQEDQVGVDELAGQREVVEHAWPWYRGCTCGVGGSGSLDWLVCRERTAPAKEKKEMCWIAEAEAFLADGITAPYGSPQALTTTNMVSTNHEELMTQAWMKVPMLPIAFMANLSSLVQPTVKSRGKEKSIAFLQSEKEKILSEKEKLADSYLDEIVCLKTANKVARDMLQRFNMPTQTIPMLSKKPKRATKDLHKDILGTRNPGLGYMAKRAQPALYDADTILHLTHQPVSIWDSEEVLVQQVVSMKKMNEKPGHVRPANGFYEKLNALKFVPQQELSREQAYWLPANERASQTSNPNRPVTPYVHKSRPPSQVLASLRNVNAAFPQFEGIIKERTTQKPDYVSEWCFDYAKQFVEQQLVPFYDHFKKHIQAANDTFFKEIREFEQIFDDLETEYEQCVLDNKNLTIEKKNLLIKNDCLIAECLEKDICSIVFTSDSVVPPSSNCLCEDLDLHAI
ncbi:hypothetical protein Tco_0320990 [Tanacetum coccineum]